MKRRIPVATVIALVLLAIALSVSATMVFAMNKFSATVSNVSARQALFEYLTGVDKVVRQNYAGTADEEVLKEKLASAYMESIGDKYADYLTSDEYAAVQKRIAGTVTGFGLELALQPEKDAIVISTVGVGSPAAQAGVLVGDVLQSVDGVTVSPTAKGMEEVRSILDDYSKMMVTVLRDGKQLSFDLASGTYSVISVTGKMIDTVGYIRITDFNDTTAGQFSAMVEDHIAAGATSLIFDVRTNSGGTLSAAVDTIGYLMPRGAFANGTASDGTVTPLSAISAYELNLPTVTLVNGATAGEAELFAGVLQEFSLTSVVGETTAGRAMIQEYFPLSEDNAAVKLSVAEMSLLKAGSWEGKGIVPDRRVTLTQTGDYLDLIEDADDEQLQAALALLSETEGSAPETTVTKAETATATATASSETAKTEKTTKATSKTAKTTA